MTHRKIRASLGACLDGELMTSERSRIEDHLRTCPGCRREFALLAKLDAFAKSIAPPPGEAAYWEAFPSRVRAGLIRGGSKTSGC